MHSQVGGHSGDFCLNHNEEALTGLQYAHSADGWCTGRRGGACRGPVSCRPGVVAAVRSAARQQPEADALDRHQAENAGAANLFCVQI